MTSTALPNASRSHKRLTRWLGAGIAVSAIVSGLLIAPAAVAQSERGTDYDVAVTVTRGGLNDQQNPQELEYDAQRGDAATDAYQLAYTGTAAGLSEFNFALRVVRLGDILRHGLQRWQSRTFSGEWRIEFTVDPTVVEANAEFLNCSSIQPQLLAENPRFNEILQCANVTYDESTGEFAVDLTLALRNGQRVTGAHLDSLGGIPDSLALTTPSGTFYVPQSRFVAGQTFAVVDGTISGWMTPDHVYLSSVPLRFSGAAAPFSITMSNNR